MDERNQFSETIDYTKEHLRHNQSRAPRRRIGNLNRSEMDQIQQNLEKSVSGYEAYLGDGEPVRTAEETALAYEEQAQSLGEPSGVYEQPAGIKEHFAGINERPAKVYEGQIGERREARRERLARENSVLERPEIDEEEKPRKKRHLFRKLLILLLIFALGFTAYSFFFRQTGYYTVAVFGLDSRSGNVGKEALSDVNILVRVDRATGEIKLVSLYRDTYTKISSSGTYHKLNEAYFRGGPEQAVWAVEHNTDVKVDDYAAFNWKAVVDAINILGGVDLEITDAEFKYINAFITETVNSTGVGSYQLESAGMNHLDGVQAVAYARLRLMDTDYQRTERQRKVIGLALAKAKSADYQTLYTLVSTILPQISTSVTIDDLIPFAKDIRKFEIAETAGFPFDKKGADVGKLDCVIPVTLESNAVKLHAFLYPDRQYAPSSELHEISEKIVSDTGLR